MHTIPFSPCVGFALDVFGNGKTSLHREYGTCSDRIGEYALVTNLRTNPPRYANPSISIFNTGNTFSNFSHSTSNSEATGFAQVPGVIYTIDAHGGLVGTRTTAGDLDLDVHASQVNSHVLDLQQAIAGFVLEFDYLGTGSRGTYI